MPTIHDKRRENTKKILYILNDTEYKKDKFSQHFRYRLPFSIKTKTYLTITEKYTDEYNRSGYSFELDTCTNKILRGCYFHAAGKSTYQESELDQVELEKITFYYGLDEYLKMMCI